MKAIRSTVAVIIATLATQACLSVEQEGLLDSALEGRSTTTTTSTSTSEERTSVTKTEYTDDAVFEEYLPDHPTVFSSARKKDRWIAYADQLLVRRDARRVPEVFLDSGVEGLPPSLGFAAYASFSSDLVRKLEGRDHDYRHAGTRTIRFTVLGTYTPVFYKTQGRVFEVDVSHYHPDVAYEPTVYLTPEGYAWLERVIAEETSFAKKLKVEFCQEVWGWSAPGLYTGKRESTKRTVCAESKVLDALILNPATRERL
jgi:hypothetical protein